MRLQVECCGAARLWCGAERVEIELSPRTPRVSDAVNQLAQRYPEFAQKQANVAYAVGDEVVELGRPLRDSEVLVLIPPVSGG